MRAKELGIGWPPTQFDEVESKIAKLEIAVNWYALSCTNEAVGLTVKNRV